ncbi:S1C family serine protease [Haloferula sp.]|uniref:S1C family serine protease n=1 Tax=Haloferula sp. TaxID=2497595 RepID=UPI0032A0132B
MNSSFRQILMLAATTCPLLAIEPPVETQPIPPRNVPQEKGASEEKGGPRMRIVPKAVPVAPELDAPEAIPVPEAAVARPYIGVILDPVPDLLAGHLNLANGEGMVVDEIVNGGPGEIAGLAVNDIITHVDGNSVGSSAEVRNEVERKGVGDQVKLSLIHEGERREVSVVLGAAPDMIPGIPHAGLKFDGANDLEGFLGNLPEEQADVMRRAMEQRLKAMEQMGNGAGMPDNWQRDLLKRMERGMQGGGDGLDFGEFEPETNVRLFDEEGSIEMKSVEGSKVVKVLDKAGNLVWEGPYDTEQDKAAVPDEIRKRIDQVDFNMGFGGEGLRLRIGKERFRPLDNLEPDGPIDE